MKTDTKNKTVLITGADGFIGQALCSHLEERGYRIIPSVRGRQGQTAEEYDLREVSPATDWSLPLNGADYVVHLASATSSGTLTKDQRKRLWLTNVDGTLNLANQAAAAGIKRFVFLSTAKVNGERSLNTAFREDDKPEPPDYYSLSKLRAEQGLLDSCAKTGMETTIIRPPLVYGPQVKGNFLRLLSWVNRGIPLPFAGLDNRRSMIGLDNLIDFIILCLEHPYAGNDTFLISDGEDLSTPEIIRRLAGVMHTSARLFPVPGFMLNLSGSLLGKRDELARLRGSLQVDSSRAGDKLSWTPPLSVNEGFKKTVIWYLNNA